MTVTVGQVLYLPPERRYSNGTELTVISIGRKWITLSNNRRCSIDKLLIDCGGYRPRQLYTSREEYEDKIRLDAAWRNFGMSVQGRRPDAATLDAIRQARELLGLPEEVAP